MTQMQTWVFRVEAASGESLGHYLGRFCRANYLSRYAIAQQLGIRQEWVEGWFTPSLRRNPTKLQLIALSKLVEVRPSQLRLMLPSSNLHLLTRLCGACYGEIPVHRRDWQKAESHSCDRHNLKLLSVCPVCQTAEIEGSCEEVQPVAETPFLYAFQHLNHSEQLNPTFQLIHKFSKYFFFEEFDR